MKPYLLWMERKLAPGLLRLLRRSIRYEITDQPANDYPCIYMFWHRDLISLCMQRIGDPVAVMVSPSLDGELIAGPAEELGFVTVRGSSNRKGTTALRRMVALAKTHQLAITPDGPKGPPLTIHHGIMQLARLSNLPIIPVGVSINRCWTVNSWDKLIIPKPFCTIRVHYGNPISIDRDCDFFEQETILRQTIIALADSIRFD